MMTTTSSQSFHRPGTGRKENSGRDSRETIHSGHFMVSDFEAEAQDDEDELAVPVPDEEAAKIAIIASTGFLQEKFASSSSNDKTSQQLSIETSLNKLFQCMSLAYRWVSLSHRFFFRESVFLSPVFLGYRQVSFIIFIKSLRFLSLVLLAWQLSDFGFWH